MSEPVEGSPFAEWAIMELQASHSGEHQPAPSPSRLQKRLVQPGQVDELLSRVRERFGVPEGEPVLSQERLT